MITSPPKFLGAYVVSASANLGWGGETSSCSLKLVEDPDNGIKFLKDTPLGTACKFVFEGFEFVGILQKWMYSESVESGRTYDVVLESPSKILDGVYLILNKFEGTFYKTDDLAKVRAPWTNDKMTYGGAYPTNIINVFADKENYSYGGYFGAADVNELGYPVKDIVSDIKTTIKKGTFGGKIYYSQSEFDLDLDKLNEVLGYLGDYRVSQDFVSLHALISDICDIGLYDFAYILTGTANANGIVTSALTIKLIIMSRRYAPDTTAISKYIKSLLDKPDESKTLASYQFGKELSDDVTQKIMIGDSATRYFLADRTMFVPIWGTYGEGAAKVYYLGNSIYEYDTDNKANLLKPITAVADGGSANNFTTLTTSILEMRCALAGRKSWNAFHVFAELAGKGYFAGGFIGSETDLQLFGLMMNQKVIPTDLMDTSLEIGAAQAAFAQFPYDDIEDGQGPTAYFASLAPLQRKNLLLLQAQIEARFNAVNKVAQTSYGTRFMVLVPGEPGGLKNNWRWIMQDVKAFEAWETAQSAWMGDVLKKYFPDMTFYDQDGRLESVALYPVFSKCDYSSLNSNYAFVPLGTPNSVGAKAEPDTEAGTNWIPFQIQDSLGNVVTETVGFTCVQVPDIPWVDTWTTGSNGWNMLAKIILNKIPPIGYHLMFGFENIDIPIAPAMMPPLYIGIPQKSNRYVWGPWYNFSSGTVNGVNGQKGKVSLFENTDMRPEVFGSVDAMNKYADYIVKSDQSMVHEAESGSATLAEVPTGNLGERMLGSGPYITGITLNIGVSGLETTYEFHSWTKSFGRIAKYNVERLVKHNKNIMAYYKKLRSLVKNPPIKSINSKKEALTGMEKYKVSNPNKDVSMPFFAMVAANYLNGGGNKPMVGGAIVSAKEGMTSVAYNYEESFMVDMQTIFSPIVVQDQTQFG